jgi:hypothetical protein
MLRKYYFLCVMLCSYGYPVGKLYYQDHAQPSAPIILSSAEESLIHFVRQGLDKSESFVSNIPEDMLFFGGHMTSPRSRHLLNNICSFPDVRYLEIGTHKGASLICALYRNKINYAYAIDNWSEFGEHEAELYHNINEYIPHYPLTFLNIDAFKANITSLPKFNIYFYDGGHATEDQEKAFTYFDPCFDDVFIAIVDDWMWDQVREGTFRAFRTLNYTLLFEKEVALRYKDDIPWRFMYICVIRKNK